MTDPKTTIKILWPDGPRWVDEDYVISAAHDALCDDYLEGKSDEEVDALPSDMGTVVPKPSLEEAIEIVNDRGILTTARLDAIDDDWDDSNGPDESMDGDHESALASCGMGTDEDYGYYGEND
jgi:hypothetical protein